MVNNVALFIGRFLLVFGGLCAFISLVSVIGWLTCEAWIRFSESFRDICRGESLIFEYRKNREKFLEWRAEDGK